MIKKSYFDVFEVMDLIISGKCGFNNDDIRGIIGIKGLLSGSQIYSLIVKDYVKYNQLEITKMIESKYFDFYEVVNLIKCGKCDFNDDIRLKIGIDYLPYESQMYSLMNDGYAEDSSEILFEIMEMLSKIIDASYDDDYDSSFHYSGDGNNNDPYIFIKKKESFMNEWDFE
jgi:hypothetical protein